VKLKSWVGTDFAVCPKLFIAKNVAESCVFRECVREYWELLKDRIKERSIPGVYLAGPPGGGKSTIVYMLAQIARVHKWLVVYVVISPPFVTLPLCVCSFPFLLSLVLLCSRTLSLFLDFQPQCDLWRDAGSPAASMGVYLDAVAIAVAELKVESDFPELEPGAKFPNFTTWKKLAFNKGNADFIEQRYFEITDKLETTTQ
jgi:hypothetical protein